MIDGKSISFTNHSLSWASPVSFESSLDFNSKFCLIGKCRAIDRAAVFGEH